MPQMFPLPWTSFLLVVSMFFLVLTVILSYWWVSLPPYPSNFTGSFSSFETAKFLWR